jgi:lysophospholipase L1-like esterase
VIRPLYFVTAALLLVTGCISGGEGATGADEIRAGAPRLLGLGDSIAYGWNPDWSQFQDGQPKNPENLQKAVLGLGYPERAAKTLGLAAANGSCPGEASGSFLDATQVDNGCREKRADGLKMTTPWGSATTQLEFAIAQVRRPNPPQVITMTLGGNDLFLLQDSCKGALLGTSLCIAAAATLGTHGAPVAKYRVNLTSALESIHAAGFRGTFVMITTYAMEYGSFGEPIVFGAFNDALRDAVRDASAVTPGMRIVVADAYEKFRQRSAEKPEFGASACKAGLLISTRNGQPVVDESGKPTCDRHPSEAGHELIAQAVVEAVGR